MVRRPQPPEPVVPDSVTIQEFDGLLNTRALERLGPKDLFKASDVDLDDAGQARRRRGQTLVDAADYHSLYASSEHVFVVRNGTLGYLDDASAFHSLGMSAGSPFVAYTEVAKDVYFSSSAVSGVIRPDLTVGAWGQRGGAGEWVSPVITPTDTLQPISGQLLVPPPLATALTYLNGRIYLAAGRVLWATELYLYGLVDRTRTYFYYEDDITMLGAVDDGIYVGTTQGVYFQSGPSLREMKREPATVGGALPGSLVVVPRGMLAPDVVGGLPADQQDVVMFTTTQGIHVGMNGGVVKNVSAARVVMPAAQRAAAMFRDQDGIAQYIASLDSDGAPTFSARVGDSIEAELIRHSGVP